MKLVGIDYGLERTGTAATDPCGIMAYPLQTFTLAGQGSRKALLAALAELASREGAERVIIGLPLMPDGSESLTTRQVRNFAARLQRRVACPCFFMNELLSSEEALWDLRMAQVKKSRVKAVLDQQAAVRILESYLARPDSAVPVTGSSGETALPEAAV
ncbi:MAG: Holliday junction resolvase RuvX [Desulfovibrionaceae bacterium]|nr:Holliday junction resolvase RuvX [Desulfovibrionaceae bacterium]